MYDKASIKQNQVTCRLNFPLIIFGEDKDGKSLKPSVKPVKSSLQTYKTYESARGRSLLCKFAHQSFVATGKLLQKAYLPEMATVC